MQVISPGPISKNSHNFFVLEWNTLETIITQLLIITHAHPLAVVASELILQDSELPMAPKGVA